MFSWLFKGLKSSGNPYTLCVIIRWRLVYNKGSNVFMWKGKWVYSFVINTPSGLGFLKLSHGCINYKKNQLQIFNKPSMAFHPNTLVMLSTVCTISSWQWCQWVFYQTLYQNSHVWNKSWRVYTHACKENVPTWTYKIAEMSLPT